MVYGVLTDAKWVLLAPLIEAVRPRGKTTPHELRRTVEAIIWRHENGAKWQAMPAELGPWWMAAQCYNRWFHLGVWQRLLALAQERGGGATLGMTFLDGSNIRAHRCAAGAAKKGGPAPSATHAKRLGAHAAALAPKRYHWLTAMAAPSPSCWLQAKRTKRHWHLHC